jgi:exopolyphosphatase / guanosine-5'-triphosphate,3'-diphosphate pyrophosphatase
MRVASIDIGTNSTRLLVADVGAEPGAPVASVERHTRITRLG